MRDNQLVAVITGAASGIGLSLAKLYLAEGYQVVMADCDERQLVCEAELLSKISASRVLTVVCDVAIQESAHRLARQTAAEFGRVDVLINNAGISGHFGPVWTLNQACIRQVLDVNLYGTLNGIQAFMPMMLEQSHPSHIANMASLYGLVSGAEVAAYAMSKHAIVALSESLYFDLQALNKAISVSVVCPSFVNTNLLQQAIPSRDGNLDTILKELMARSRPPDEVARHIVRDIQQGIFYILPDREVMEYCHEHSQAIVEQQPPHRHNLDKLMHKLLKRAKVSKAEHGR